MIHAVPANAGGPLPAGADPTEAPSLHGAPHRQKTIADLLANINVISLMAYGRAGSLLIQSLFDSHPNVVTLPYAGAMFSLIPASINNLNRQIDWFIKRFPMIFDTSGGGYFGDVKTLGAGNFGPNGDEDLRVSSTDFKKKLLGLVNEYCTIDSNQRLPRKEFFVLVHMAYGLCHRTFNVTDIRYICYHTHTHDHDEWQTMLEDFPELYFIGMTRDPRQDWLSWKKIYSWRMQRDVPRMFLVLHQYNNYSKGCYELSKLVEKLKDDHIRIIDLEKLHISNIKAMTHLCSWLNIEFDGCLLQSTFNGRQWHGNATNGKRTSSLNPDMTRDTWRKELPDHDRKLICSLVPGSLKYFGYEKEHPATSVVSDDFKYRSELLLLIHCIRFRSCLWNNPGRKFWQSGKLIDKIRIMRRLTTIAFEGVRLFLELKGDGLDRQIAEIVAQQKELLRKNLPQMSILELPLHPPTLT